MNYDDFKTEAPEDRDARLGTHYDDVPDEDDDEPSEDDEDIRGDAWEGGFCENH